MSDQVVPEPEAADSALPASGPANELTSTFTPPPEYVDDEPASFSFGMILFVLSLIVSIAMIAYEMQVSPEIDANRELRSLVNPDSRIYVPTVGSLVYFEWIIRLPLVFAAVFLIVLFVGKLRAFLTWVRVYLIAYFLILLVDVWALTKIEASLREKQLGLEFDPFIDLLHSFTYLYGILILVTFIWFRYFTTSKRVKQTFIR